jgi:hypothetical protein
LADNFLKRRIRMSPCDWKRRQFLQRTALASLAVGLPGFAFAAEDTNQVGGSVFKPDVEIELTAKTETVSLRPGPATRVFRYHAQLRKGPSFHTHKNAGLLGAHIKLRSWTEGSHHFP